LHTEAQRLLAEAELRAERTAAGLRLVVAALLGIAALLVAIGPTPEANVVPMRHLIIPGYFALGLLALGAAHPRAFRPWMPWAFTTLDIVFVVGSTALGLANMALPSNYAMSMPMVWLAPLVLAFAAMRVNHYLQAYVALLLVAGLALTVSVDQTWQASVGPPSASLEPLFAGPPNIMRLVMVMLTGLVLVIAAARSRAILLRAIDETTRRANLTRYLPPRIAEWLAETSVDEVRRGRRQRVAVLFADIRGFTQRAETMDPTALGRFIAEFRRRVSAAADLHGGVIDKFIGDSAMLVFGVPQPGPVDARNALRCADALLAGIAEWNEARQATGEDRVELGIGVHWGEVFCGAIGDETRLEYTVLGDTVNVASRLEQEAKAASLRLIVSQDLLDAADEPAPETRWIALRPHLLRGRHQPIQLFGMGPIS
jgi:adenylate cyclase